MSQTSDTFHVLIWGGEKTKDKDAMAFRSQEDMEDYLINAYRGEYLFEGEEPYYAQISKPSMLKVSIKLGVKYE